MVPLRAALAVLTIARTFVHADLHHVFVPSFTSPHLYSLEYDDAKETLVQAGHTVGHDGHPWISFSYDKAALYAGETNGFASYKVNNSSSLSYKKSVPLPGPCSQKMAGFGTTYITSLQKAPFTVYGAPFGACLSAMRVEPDGTLLNSIQNITLESTSGIHGLAMGPDADFLFSADLSANGIWVHKVNQETGALTEVSFTPAPSVNAEPRHLIVHPSGRYLYVVMEAKNEVRVYAINFGQRSSQVKITDTGLSYSLIPKGSDPADYMANEVILSTDGAILFASTRYRALRKQPQDEQAQSGRPLTKKNGLPLKPRRSKAKQKRAPGAGYVTAILLLPQNEGTNARNPQGAGFPLRQLFQSKTTTSGGMSNAVSPASWDRNYFTISDTEVGQVEVWKIEGMSDEERFYDGAAGQNAATPARGGWESGMWVEDPNVAGQPAPAPATPHPVSPPKPKSPPTNPWAPKSGGNGGLPRQESDGGNPWDEEPDSGSRGGQNDDDDDEKQKQKNKPEEDEDENEKRRKGKVRPGAIGPLRRLVPVAPPAAAAAPVPVVTAKVVATWKAPKANSLGVRRSLRDGGLLGRRQSKDSVPAAGGCCGNALWWD
ncbi:carboxy-cis/cis-muconate cyclase [Venturia nashicola]|uniref:Carboxy-cis/cis-muconate cyclase n=1 Tax=Venturia nashicola TaxID=86259 RepID=A0A4Z1PWL2_9PEZI|nr:carboxy-cis/cis-muconate cyclase [Venturia nashicola]